MEIVTIINFWKHKDELDALLNEKQKEVEFKRPERKSCESFEYIDRYCL